MVQRNAVFVQRLFALVIAGVMSLVVSGAAVAQSESYTIIAERAVMPDGTLRANVAVEVRGGKIERVVEADRISANANVIRLPKGAVLSPGLIDLASSLGVEGSQVEDTKTIDPAVEIRDGFDKRAPVLRRALEAGVTAAMLIPAPANIVSGQTFTVRTHPSNSAEAGASLLINVSSSAFDFQQGPTSRAGLLFELRNALKDAKAQPADVKTPMTLAVRGEMPVVIACNTVEEVDSALMLIAEYGLDATLAISDAAIELVDDLAEAEVPVMYGPLDFGSSRRSLVLPGMLASKGVTVGFIGDLPAREPESLRTTAALAVRNGMDAAAARRALTSDAARIAGATDTLGAIRAGLSADLVVFSDDPLRLDATVLEVHIAGQRVYAAPHDTHDFGGGAP